ncbi:MAG TPA: glycosyltransferase family 4 protein [Chitinispirillaceae bacterium]|nr:glycosyltransferase family 4 protein [Chitinispirillaceae bacterium]
MKIAFFNKNLPSDQPNGVSIQVHYLANALVDLGHDVTCFSFSPPLLDSRYKVHTFSYGKTLFLFRKFIPAIKFRTIDCTKFDIVHYHGDDYLCKNCPTRVRTFYGSALMEAIHAATMARFFYQALFYLFEWISCFKPGKLIGISANTTRALPLVKEVIPCGVPLQVFCPDNSVRTSHPSILFLGGLLGRKRGNLMIKIFHQSILPRYPDCTLTIVGPQACSGPNIKYISKLEETELVRLYRSHWVYCQMSSYEGFGVPVLEAMACGTAVVAIRNAGAKEIVTDGLDGFCCTNEDIAERIVELIANRELRNHFYCNGLQTAGKYDMREAALLYEKEYRSLQCR